MLRDVCSCRSGESKSSSFEGFRYGMNAFMRDENIIREISCFKENRTTTVSGVRRRRIGTEACVIRTSLPVQEGRLTQGPFAQHLNLDRLPG